MTFRQVIIFGAGAIGLAYGAFLSSNIPVTLVGRPVHMNAINENGLTVLGDRADTYTENLITTTKVKKIPPKTLLIVSLKALDLQKSLSSIQSLIRNDTTLLLLQNGLGIEEIAIEAVQKQGTITRAIVRMGSEILEPGRVKVQLNLTLFDSDEPSKQIAQIFKESGLKVVISDSFKVEVWKKVTINCVTNPLSAILQVQTNQLISPKLTNLRQSIVKECMAVAAAEGIELDSSLVHIMDQTLPRYTNRTSMLQDIQRGKKTEIGFLNGKIVELGETHGIPTPVNAVIVQLIKFMESVQK